MSKSYYLLEVHSTDLVFYSFQEKHTSLEEAFSSLETAKTKYRVDSASIRKCEDVLIYSPEPRLPKKRSEQKRNQKLGV